MKKHLFLIFILDNLDSQSSSALHGDQFENNSINNRCNDFTQK